MARKELVGEGLSIYIKELLIRTRTGSEEDRVCKRSPSWSSGRCEEDIQRKIGLGFTLSRGVISINIYTILPTRMREGVMWKRAQVHRSRGSRTFIK